jgi:hypothetical protein
MINESNNNLLTEAESPAPLHLYYLILSIYIRKYLQMEGRSPKTSTTSLSYVNGQLKDTKPTTTTYNPNYAYSPATITENWNGRITTQETYYTSEPGLGILAEPIEEITSINGEMVSHVKRTYNNGNITSESKLVDSGKWYAQFFTYDSIGNVINSI